MSEDSPNRSDLVDVILKRSSVSEILAVKALVDIAGYGVAEAKDVLDRIPAPILAASPMAVVKAKAAALRNAGLHVEIVPSAANTAGPRSDGVYFSPVIETIRKGLVWRRKLYRRLALRFNDDGSCEEYAVDFPKESLPSVAVQVLGSILTHPGPGDVRDLGEGRIEKDGMTWDFVPSVRSVSR